MLAMHARDAKEDSGEGIHIEGSYLSIVSLGHLSLSKTNVQISNNNKHIHSKWTPLMDRHILLKFPHF